MRLIFVLISNNLSAKPSVVYNSPSESTSSMEQSHWLAFPKLAFVNRLDCTYVVSRSRNLLLLAVVVDDDVFSFLN